MFTKSLARLEKLETSLTRRYQFKKEEEAIEERTVPSTATAAKQTENGEPAIKDEFSGFEDRREIHPEELYFLVTHQKAPSVMIVDVRNDAKFVFAFLDPVSNNTQVVQISPDLLNRG